MTEPDTKKPRKRKWLWIAFVVMAFLVMLPIAAYLTLKTPFASAQLTKVLNSQDGISVGAISGDLLSDLTVSNLKLEDAQGVWAHIHSAQLKWSPKALLDRTVHVESIVAGQIDLLRQPISAEDDTPSEPFNITEALDLPVSITVDDLKAGDIRWVPEQQQLALEGRAVVRRNESVDIRARMTPQGAGDRVVAELIWDGQTAKIDAMLDVYAPGDGIIAAFASLPDNMTFIAYAEGTADTWDGALKARLKRTNVVNLKAVYAEEKGTLNGFAIPGPFLPVGTTDLLDEALKVDISFMSPEPDVLRLTGSIGNKAAQLDVAGQVFADFRPQDFQLSVKAQGTAADTTFSGAVFKTTLDDRDGTLSAPIELRVSEVENGNITAKGLMLNGSIEQSKNGLSFPFEGQLQQVSGIEGVEDDLLSDFTFKGDLRQNAEGELAAVFGVNVADASLELRDISQSAEAGLGADFELRVPDLSGWPGNIPAELKTSGALSAPVEGAPAVTLSGTLQPKGETGHWVEPLAAGGLKFEGGLAFPENGIQVDGLNLSSDSLLISGSAEMEAANLVAEVKARLNDGAVQPTLGAADIQLAFSGPLATTLPTGVVKIETLKQAGLIAQDIELQLESQGAATRLQLTGKSNQGPLRANGVIQRLPDDIFAIEQLKLALANLSAQADGQVPGVMTFQTELSPAAPGLNGIFDLSGNVALDGRYDMAAQMLTLSGGGEFLRYGPANAPTAQVGTLEVDGQVDLSADLPKPSLTLDAQSISAAGLLLDSVNVDAQTSDGVSQADIQLKQNGATPTDMTVALTYETRGTTSAVQAGLSGVLGGQDISTEVPISALLTADGFEIEPATITLGPGQLSLVGKQNTQALEFSVQAEALSLLALSDTLQMPPIRGNLDTKLDIQSTPGTGRIAFSATLNDVASATVASPDTTMASVDATSQGNLLDIRGQAATSADDSKTQFSASLPLSWPQTAGFPSLNQDGEITAQGDIAATLAPWWVAFGPPDQALAGELTGTIAVSGTVAEPKPDVQLKLRETRYEHLELGTRLENLSADITAKDNELAVTNLRASDGGTGSLTGAATAQLDPFLPRESSIKLTAFRALSGADLSATTSADLKLEAKDGRLGLAGDVLIDEARYKIAKAGGTSVAQLPVEEINGPEEPAEPAAEVSSDTPIVLDLNVTAPRRIFVTGLGLTSEWRTDLDVSGPSDNPSVVGQVRLVRGDLEFAGKRFTLERGAIYLDGQADVEPRLDLLAQNTQGDFTARIAITGTPSAPEIGLSSDPALPEDEILSRILFGTSATNLSALEAVQLGSALAALSGGGSGGLDVAGKVRSVTGLDRLSLGSDESATSITGGKYITEDVFLQLTTDPSSGQYLAGLEWYITRSLSLLSEYAADGNNTVAGRWSKNY